MKLAKDFKGLTTLLLVLLLVIFFLLGAVLSYIWTMGFYAPGEFNLPSQGSLTIEEVNFYPEQPSFFNMTLLNPSYSPEPAKITQINVHTNDDKFHVITTTSPSLSSLSIAPGESQTIKSDWNWANYTDQNVDVYVILAEGSGSAIETRTAFMNLTVTSIVFEPSITSTRFNVTVKSTSSPASVDIDSIIVNGAEVADTSPALPYRLDPNSTVDFTVRRDWVDLQDKTVTVAVRTVQGYVASNSATAPQVRLSIDNIVFYNTTETSFYFNITVQNSALSSAKVDVDSISVHVEGQNMTISAVNPLPQALEPAQSILLTFIWDWNPYRNQNATIVVHTAQGFESSIETPIQGTP